MKEKNNVKCVICGKEYHYCNSCDSHKPSWMMSFCSDNCRRIYNVASCYNAKTIDGERALDEVKQLDISKIENFSNATKRIIKSILSLDKKEEDVVTMQMDKEIVAQDVIVTPKNKSIKKMKRR